MPSIKFQANLSQRLILTAQLKQRIDMLAMTKLELLNLINQQLQENPVLEEVTEPITDAQQSLSATERDEFPTPAQQSPSETNDASSSESPADPFDHIDFDSFFQEYLAPGPRTPQSEVREEDSSLLEKLTPQRENLYDHLMWQLRLCGLPEETLVIAEAIIGNLNQDGYLEATLEEIAAMGPWPMEAVREALAVVQSLDPPGVGARDLRECLLLQLKERGWENTLAATLVADHMEELRRRQLPELAKKLHLPLDVIEAELARIQQLDPRPARNYDPTVPQYITPEVSIVKIGDEYRLIFNDDGMPHLRISPTYQRMLEGTDVSKEVRDFVRERFRSALELIRNIEHRKRAIYRVCEAIVRRQRDFLDYGPEYLKPMLLKDIAEELHLSLSTISRVVNNKYVETPQGIMELRRFFTEGLTRDDGREISTRVIKLRIKTLIEREDPRRPLTDDEIVNILARDGIRLSRRTVTKYRKLMGIPSSRDRRVQ